MRLVQQNDSSSLADARRVLLAGGVIVVPTETVYGLATLWSNQAGRELIYELKKRPAEKRLQMLAADLATAEDAGLLRSHLLDDLAKSFWPGELTVVAEACEGQTIGLRVPRHEFLLELLRTLPEPLAATSANLSGEPAALTADAAVAGLAGEPALVVDGGAVEVGQSSTVVSVVGGELKILRPGPISESRLLQALKKN